MLHLLLEEGVSYNKELSKMVQHFANSGKLGSASVRYNEVIGFHSVIERIITNAVIFVQCDVIEQSPI